MSARDLVDEQVAWMAGPGRPSPQRADEEDGAAAEFLVNDALVVVFASHAGEVEIYALASRGITIWDFSFTAGGGLTAEQRAVVVDTLVGMGAQVRFPVAESRTVWPVAADG